MHKRTLLNLVMLAIVMVLVAIAVYEPGKKTDTPVPLTDLAREQITQIEILRENPADTIRLEKTGQQWQMLAPYTLPANDFRIDNLLKLAAAESLAQHDLGGLDKKQFGLDKPRISIRFNNSLTIHFGGTDPLQNRRYLQVDNRLHMITDLFYYQVAADTTSFINHQLLPEDFRITGIKLPGLKLALNDAKWQLTPAGKSESADSITGLVNEWKLSQAYQLKIHKGDLPAVDIIIQQDDTRSIQFSMIKSENDFILLRHDNRLQYILSKDRRDVLLKLAPHPATQAGEQTPRQ